MCFGGGASQDTYSASGSGHLTRYENLLNLRDNLLQQGQDTSEVDGQIRRLSQAIGRDPAGSAEMNELERQMEITRGKRGIDKAFSKFDDSYYGNFKNAYLDNYNPQLDEQYGDAKSRMAASLAGRGMLESSVGADALSGLFSQYTDTRSQIGNKAQDAANQLRGNVETTKTNLYSLNSAAGDAQGMNARAIGEASAMAAPTSYDPIGEVFASAIQPIANYTTAAQNRPRPYSSPVRLPSGSGSGSVIG